MVLLVGALTTALGLVPAAAAPAQPPPGTAEEAAARLEQVQREAEVLTEEWHAAQDALTARQDELETLQEAVEPTRRAADEARAAEEQYRIEADALVVSTFESGNLDQFNALLASGSPEDFLDQMSALEMLASDQRSVLGQLLARIDATTAARTEADAAVARARAATDAAAAAEADLETRQREAELRIDEAEELLEQLTPEQRADRTSGGPDGPEGPVSGSGVGVEALNAAIDQLGKPYQWGAEGPGSFDCSGLTSWAFSRAGVTLPRSSSQQANVGQSVSRGEIRAGDLVFFYSPVSHVGIAVDNDTIINAPQTGDVVKYSEIDRREFHSARRF
jgi:cell wall-associated NlpC family hydrolase